MFGGANPKSDEDLDLHMIVIVPHLVPDPHFHEDLLQLVLEPHIVDAPEALNAVIASQQARIQQTGGADHLLHQLETQKDHPRGLPEIPLDVLHPQFIRNGYTLHNPLHETRDLVPHLPETTRPQVNLRIETETRPDLRRGNVLLCVL
jgi:hypothetical protein